MFKHAFVSHVVRERGDVSDVVGECDHAKTATRVDGRQRSFREILREARQFDAQQLLVVASQTVVDALLDEESSSVVELGEFIGIPIRFQVESAYTQEQYDVVLL